MAELPACQRLSSSVQSADRLPPTRLEADCDLLNDAALVPDLGLDLVPCGEGCSSCLITEPVLDRCLTMQKCLAKSKRGETQVGVAVRGESMPSPGAVRTGRGMRLRSLFWQIAFCINISSQSRPSTCKSWPALRATR